jgi:hypothetical protein
MRREELAALGIQLPVLPTIVLGGLPGRPDWAPRLERLGLDVVASGANPDTPATFAAAASVVPHRPVKAAGCVPGARLVECEGDPPDGACRVDPDEVVIAVDGPDGLADPSDIARHVLTAAAVEPSAWWVAARGLDDVPAEVAEARLAALVEGVHHVRLYLAKQQFD